MNSFWDLEKMTAEQVGTPEALRQWLRQRGLIGPGARLGAADLRRALDVREGLRALMFANNGSEADHEAIAKLNRALRGPGLFVSLSPASPPEFKVPRRDLEGALALIATIAAVAQLEGRWSRLKACPGEHCGWAFYDHSRNQASNWCAMSVCGSRAKAREYRRRKRRSHA